MVNALTRARRGLCLALLTVTMLAWLACGNESPDAVAPTPVPDPVSLLAVTATNLRTVQSTKFRLSHDVGSLYLPGYSTKITEIVGAWDVGAGAELTIDAYLVAGPESDVASGTYVEVGAVITPEAFFSTEPISGLWLKQPVASSPISVARLQHLVADMVDAVENPALVGEEPIDGDATYRISGVMPASAMDWLIAAASGAQPLEIEVWTDADRRELRQLAVSGAIGEFDLPDTLRTIRLTEIGEPVDITPPEQFIDLSGG